MIYVQVATFAEDDLPGLCRTKNRQRREVHCWAEEGTRAGRNYRWGEESGRGETNDELSRLGSTRGEMPKVKTHWFSERGL